MTEDDIEGMDYEKIKKCRTAIYNLLENNFFTYSEGLCALSLCISYLLINLVISEKLDAGIEDKNLCLTKEELNKKLSIFIARLKSSATNHFEQVIEDSEKFKHDQNSKPHLS